MAYAKTGKFDFKISFTGIEIPLEVLEKAIVEENPTIYFNDLECYYWIFDFSFEWKMKRIGLRWCLKKTRGYTE